MNQQDIKALESLLRNIVREEAATKDDIASIRKDMQSFATKEDMRHEVGEAVGQITSAIEAGRKEDRALIDMLDRRTTRLESIVLPPKH